MKKIGLFVFILAFAFFTKAQQPVAPGFDQTNYPQFSINLAVLGNPSRSNADVFFDEGERYERFGDFEGAVSMFSRAAKEYHQNKKFSRYGTALIRLSNAQAALENNTEAEKIILKQVLKIYTKIGSKAGQMAAYQQLGKIYLAANKLTQSLWFYTQQGILAKQLQNKNAYIESVLGIAAVKIRKKEYQLAAKDLSTAELLAKNANIIQYNQLIKTNRALIAKKTAVKKS